MTSKHIALLVRQRVVHPWGIRARSQSVKRDAESRMTVSPGYVDASFGEADS
jgi:hypothetical protein